MQWYLGPGGVFLPPPPNPPPPPLTHPLPLSCSGIICELGLSIDKSSSTHESLSPQYILFLALDSLWPGPQLAIFSPRYAASGRDLN